MRTRILLIAFVWLCLGNYTRAHDELVFTQNKGQWHENVLYRAKMEFGNFYLEKNAFTYLFYEKSVFSKEAHAQPDYKMPDEIKAHAIRTSFLNANPNPLMDQKKPSTWYENYFTGNDPNKWATEVRAFKEVYYNDLYDFIDLKVYQYANYAKYDFIVTTGGNPDEIKLSYEGYDNMYIKNGSLYLENSLGYMVEKAPLAYQMIDGEQVEVPCKYVLKDGQVTFKFPRGYDEDYDLVIDPILVFSSYTGSTTDNWGFTATYDNQEYTYAGGIVFGAGYPVTTGAFQMSFAGGLAPTCDIGISKFLPDGSNLVYSTYLGGTGVESPHSLVVDDFDNLFVLSTTASTDFPVTAGAFQTVFGGGIGFTPNYYAYNAGSDIAVTKFNANGTALLGSTFVGGSDNDGLNSGNAIKYFYGDDFRGEIIVDAGGNPIVTSCTKSADFPVSANAPQPTNAGAFDAVVFRMNSSLTAMPWSTYWGGSGDDTGFGIQLDSNGDIYISGGTSSSDLNTTPGALNGTYLGGVDGYITKFSSNGNTVMGSTYLGTGSKDLTFFIQIDGNDDVYVIGVSEGAYPVSAGLYTNPNSNQFIQKLDNALTTNIWSTVIGTGNGTVDVSPTAFLVNNCGLIYWSGWGGSVNATSVPSSTTTGLPTTPNGLQLATSGSDFYFMVLSQEAQSILYATFLGGTSPDHVDGGTSRFDKKGIVYHAVCAGCGGNSNFPTTPGAWSQTNNASNCNLAVFKFGINNIQTLVSVPAPYVCIPNSYQFNNNTTGANQYFWDFGDGNTSTDFQPNHTYTDTGQYTVTLIASDTSGCIEADTAELIVDVYAINDGGILAIPPICPGDSIDLEAYGGDVYSWYPNQNILNPNSYNPTVFPDSTFTYYAIVHDSCSTDTVSIVVEVYENTVSTSPDTVICIGQSTQISGFGGVNYEWQADPTLSNLNIQDPDASPATPTWYFVDVTTADGCVIRDSVFVDVILTPPNPTLPNDTTICQGDTISMTASGATSIQWMSTYNIDAFGAQASLWPEIDFYYVAEFANACGTLYDSVLVSVDRVVPGISNDTTICPNDTALLVAWGGDSYIWTPVIGTFSPTNDSTLVTPSTPTTYTAEVINANGCSADVSVFVDLFPGPQVHAGPDKFIEYGESVQLNGSTNAHLYWWTPADSLDCFDCLNPVSNPSTLTNYILYGVDQNGCRNSDTVTVYIDAVLYVPNAFTANGDGMNDIFYAFGKEIKTFEMLVFNRWGEVIFSSSSLNNGWDGTYKGIQSPSDVYVWKIRFTDYIHPEVIQEKVGHVTLVR